MLELDAPWSYSDTGPKNQRNCVQCGRAIEWDANACPYCGHDYRKNAGASPVGQSVTQAQTRGCVACGRTIAWDANVCQYCGHDYRAQTAGQIAGSSSYAMTMRPATVRLWTCRRCSTCFSDPYQPSLGYMFWWTIFTGPLAAIYWGIRHGTRCPQCRSREISQLTTFMMGPDGKIVR